ncbi:MYND-type zinc finger protein samB [Parastagonospora nodorum]|uniref:MYND-type zinc finger protein samB n=2 Tax=Phaeosphaeria nodorum (strain SN15 / ATCC MYA-4574 / FGSC 10173) TaxID=321614 RepID=A0A7U2I0A9_PHANO|nr:hypothetical protein SNOG_02856 [Parastagonospora nodorum SN15]KAH3919628.1 MYND-type zinc finger protein samB [Parastagonospora nodorum]EAT89587.1 hypothetical protein SNOG_02856 [Parastagonospora nodorum SN15]KAH3937222.1 MYND-type zinc finger protein samB [Parastagonospora nodorum]KAH3953710.1 MYND-type zinc finger protein samB [Parastagonospora nodorum]KAH3969301.1 MYND-type zinc finger protein samB [Parastagonospora nodorum]
MADPKSTEELCAMCNNMGVHACSGCHSIRYCSKLCQKTDWSLHKLLCKSFKNFSNDQRPQPHGKYIYRRAIHFPEHGDTPQFVWMRHFGPNESNRTVVDSSSLHADCADLKPLMKFGLNFLLRRPLTGWVIIAGRPCGLNKDGMVKAGHANKSMLKVDEEMSDWAGGALIAYGNDGANWPTGTAGGAWQDQVYDLGPVHLRHVIDNLRDEHDKTGREFELCTKGSKDKVKGVRINCIGDEIMCCRNAMEPVDVARSLCTEQSDINSDMADRIGVPIIIRKIPHALCWRGRNIAVRNSGAVVPGGVNTVMMVLDLKSQVELFPENLEISWMVQRFEATSGQLGSCVVVRKDGKPLEPIFMEALEVYTRLKVKNAKNENEDEDWEKVLFADVSEEDWEGFFKDFDPDKDYKLDRNS